MTRHSPALAGPFLAALILATGTLSAQEAASSRFTWRAPDHAQPLWYQGQIQISGDLVPAGATEPQAYSWRWQGRMAERPVGNGRVRVMLEGATEERGLTGRTTVTRTVPKETQILSWKPGPLGAMEDIVFQKGVVLGLRSLPGMFPAQAGPGDPPLASDTVFSTPGRPDSARFKSTLALLRRTMVQGVPAWQFSTRPESTVFWTSRIAGRTVELEGQIRLTGYLYVGESDRRLAFATYFGTLSGGLWIREADGRRTKYADFDLRLDATVERGRP